MSQPSSMYQIDPQKVLLITNSNIAQSGVDAADYVARRGLNSNNVISFNFGSAFTITDDQLLGTESPAPLCQSGAYVGRYFYDAVANYIVDNDIDAVILSTYTPANVPVIQGGWPLASMAGMAYDKLYGTLGSGFYNPGLNKFIKDASAVSGTGWSTYRNTSTKIICSTYYNWKDVSINPRYFRPHGRLGSPVNNGGVIAEQSLRGGATSIYNNAVTKGLAAEQVNQIGTLHAFGDATSNVSYGIYVTPTMNDLAYQWCSTLGLTNRVRLNDVYPPLSGQGYLSDDSTFVIKTPLAASSTLPQSVTLDYAPATTSGTIRVENEQIAYNGLSGVGNKTLTITQRGYNGTSVVAHAVDSGGIFMPYKTPYINLPGALFALCVGDEFNNIGDYTALQNAFTCADGAWGFTWTSGSYIFGDALLYNGGTAALNTVNEPYGYSLAFPQEIFLYTTYYKIPLMLAQFHSYGLINSPYVSIIPFYNAGFTVTGDPLYNPYKSTTFSVAPSTGVAVDNLSGAFSKTALLASVSTPNTTNAWFNISPTQSASWNSINPTQTPNWSSVSPSQNPNWTPIN